ncbi:MAG: hypothetical protein HYV51_02240 [Parcubacteria group bacterium]|nr:hypothetical protein [Parcubacteria group bacterium]
MEIFKLTQENIHPKIVEFFEKIKKWHEENGYRYGAQTIDDVLEQCIVVDTGTFIILIQDGGEKYHENCGVVVFNKNGIIIDSRIYFNPIEGQKVPKKAFIGIPIIDGSKVMKFKPHRKKEKQFQPPI